MIATILATALSLASDVDRTQAPPAAQEPSWLAPAPVSFAAAGMKGLLIERHELPIVELMIGWYLGDVLDPPGKDGMHALCIDLIGESTKDLDNSALADRKADVGAAIGIGAGRESAQMTLRATKANLPAALDLAMMLLREPGLRSEDLERLRSQRKASVMQSRGNADAAAGRVFAPVMYGFSHPYGHLVTEKSLDAVSQQDCARIAKQLRPVGAHLLVVGDVTAREMAELFSQRTLTWQGKAPVRTRVGPPQAALDGKAKATVYFVDVPDAAQSRVIVAHHGPGRAESDYYATTLMAQVLGGGIPSRLVQNLRERNGYTYGVSARYAYARSGSVMTIASSVRTDVTAKALIEVMSELKGLAQRPASADEISREREGTVRALPSRFGNGSQTLASLWELVFFDLPLDSFAKLPSEVNAVDEPAVQAAVRSRLRSDDLTVVVAGDKAKVLPELEGLARDQLFAAHGLVIVDADGRCPCARVNARPTCAPC